ncbi:FUSC family protein [Paramagnetospirillum magneticum]|uniref:Predicted membrane protein n=1 Tax=Paramagnetospirillum magneticum (strain ATCC 700264 / AMB-1) TaxID=342108 RepID=Q2W811_PARM1|nr:FUSC family protein [Paramagnetospirillum magneticum]BAE50014.1 Predicted membrane protein [Paramagnetospirillum magneticum AMB-1]
MMPPWNRFLRLLSEELRHFTTIHPSDRSWQMPLAAALASGLPLLVGCSFDRLDYGMVSSLGGMVFLYLPPTPLYHRMVLLMASAFAMIACYTLGMMSHLIPVLMMPVLVFIAILTTMLCRYYRVGVPGSLFFIMAASIGAYSPVELLQIPLMVGLLSMGALLASLIAFFYSLEMLRLRPAAPIEPLPPASFDFVIFDSVVIGAFVGASLALAQVLHLEKAYWVPVSCLAVIQGTSLRAVWNRQIHRIVGTGLGMLLAWGLLSLPLNNWGIAVTMMLLTFAIETAIVRHYAFAVVLITPLTILLAEAATMGQGSAAELIQSRFIDTCLGSFVGLLGGICIHSPRFRAVTGKYLRRLIPTRFQPPA